MSFRILKKKSLLIFSFLVFVMFFSYFVSAADVAYIYKNGKKIDQNVIKAFEDMTLSVELINVNDFSSKLSSYDAVFIGDERLPKIKEISEIGIPMIVMNKYYGKEFGLVEKGGIGQISSSRPLNIYVDGEVVPAYEYSGGETRRSMKYYYVPERFCSDSSNNIATTEKMFSRTRKGSVVSFTNELCFFGLVASDHWSEESKKLFENCVNSVLGTSIVNCMSNLDCGVDGFVGENSCQDGNVVRTYNEFTCENPGTSQSRCIPTVNERIVETCSEGCENGMCIGEISDVFHDIGFVNVTNAVGIVRLQTSDGVDVLDGEDILCNEKYKIIVRVKNKGNFSENITFDGSLGSLEIDHGAVNELETEKTSDRTKTMNITLPAGDYYLNIEALLDGLSDANPLDNLISKPLKVVCGEEPGTGACSSDSDCPADSFSGLYCSTDEDSYKDLISYSCENPGTATSACVSVKTPQLVEDCNLGCLEGTCLSEWGEGIHDIALVNVTNAVGSIRIRENSVDVPAGDHLQCNHKYQIIIRAKNLGNYTENITFVGSMGSLELDYSASVLDSGKTSDRTKTVNVTLPAGVYNINVEAILNGFADANALNNVASKQVVVDC